MERPFLLYLRLKISPAMKSTFNIKSCFYIACILTLVGALFTIQHYVGAAFILLAAIPFSIIFLINALSEIHRSSRLSGSEKIIWTIGLLMTSGIAGLVYVSSARKRTIGN